MSTFSMEPFGVAIVAVAVAFVAALLFLLISSLVWVYRDANLRGKPGWLVALLVFLFDWPFSLLMWCVFRPALPVAHAGNMKE